ncbi:hypothetical protein KKF84_03330, partial [Myxococcota bacterium]|nr:hypothetical protein [Myxococcota bacterium]
MTYEVIPSAFAALITSVIIFVTGLSVLLKNQKAFINRAFFTYTVSLFFYFFLYGLMMATSNHYLSNLRFIAAVIAGLTASWFFRLFLFGKGGTGASRYYLVLTFLAVAVIVFDSIRTMTLSHRIVPAIVLSHVIISAFSVFASITHIIRTTHASFVRKRLQYLTISSAVFVSFLLVTHSTILGQKMLYLGHGVAGIYIYFLGQTILQRRFMDLHELLTRTGILVGIITLISMVYFGLIFWIPIDSRELLLISIFVGSIIVLLLMEPFEKLSGEWVKFFFWRRKAIAQTIAAVELELEFVWESENSVAAVVMDKLHESDSIEGCGLFLLDNDRVHLSQLAMAGITAPDSISVGSHRELVERLSFSPYVLKEEVEQELDRLKRGWSISLGVENLQAILESMDLLQCDLAISIRSQNKFAGVLTLRDTPVGDPFTESDVMVFRQLAKKIGNALENTARYKRAREQERLAMLGKMASGLAHEIRNPLGAIRGAAQLLQDDESIQSTEMKQFLSIITEETQRLNKTVNTFLEFSRSEHIQLGELRLSEIVKKIIPMVATMAPHVAIIFDPPGDLPPVLGNEDKLKQVLLNLVLNAVQAMEDTPDPRIIFSLGQEGLFQTLSVSDSGGGIAAEAVASIFDPFFT